MSITTVGGAAGGRPQNADLIRRGTVSVRDFVSVRDNPVVVDQQSNFQILGSDRVELEGNLVAPQGTSVKVASAEFASVVLDGRITTLDGCPGSSAENDAQNAGSISVGGFFGQNQTVNPYSIYVGSYDNAGTIDVKLRLTPGRSPAVGLDVTAPAAFRDIVKTPAQAAITATRVTSCP